MAAGAVIWVIGVVLLAGSALVLPALSAHRRRGTGRPPAAPERTAARQPPAGRPAGQPRAVTAERHEVIVDDAGLTVRVRGYGYATNWATRCALPWADVVSLAMDTGTYDSIVSLYATTSNDHFRKHLLDGRALSRDQWTELSEIVAVRTGGRITVDLAMLDEDRPHDRF